MSTTVKHNGKAHSIPGGLVIAGTVSMLITVILSAAIANFLNTERMTWEQAGYWIMAMLFVASFTGGKCAFWAIKRQRLVATAMSGILYWGLLLCITALFFGGNFCAVWETAGIIGAGCGVAALLHMPVMKKRGAAGRRANR